MSSSHYPQKSGQDKHPLSIVEGTFSGCNLIVMYNVLYIKSLAIYNR